MRLFGTSLLVVGTVSLTGGVAFLAWYIYGPSQSVVAETSMQQTSWRLIIPGVACVLTGLAIRFVDRTKPIQIAGGCVWVATWATFFSVLLVRSTAIDVERIGMSLLASLLPSTVAFFVCFYAPARILYNLASPARRSRMWLETGSLSVIWLAVSVAIYTGISAMHETEQRRKAVSQKLKNNVPTQDQTTPSDDSR